MFKTLFVTALFFSVSSFAQSTQNLGEDAEKLLRKYSENKAAELKLLRDLKVELFKRSEEKRAELLNNGLKADYLAKVIQHIESRAICAEYEGFSSAPARVSGRAAAPTYAPNVPTDGAAAGVGNAAIPTAPFTNEEWSKICDSQISGKILSGVCSIESAKVAANFNANVCKEGLKAYQDAKAKFSQVDDTLASVENKICSDNLNEEKTKAPVGATAKKPGQRAGGRKGAR